MFSLLNKRSLGMETKDSSISWKPVRASLMARNTNNPIRNIVDNMILKPNPDKKMIALSIGDPTTFGNLPLCDEIIEAVDESMRSGTRNGYCPSVGYEDARDAVAIHHSTPDSKLTAKDVILTCGCSGALEMAISVLAGPGDNILIPSPGFPFYAVLADSMFIDCKRYKLLPERAWEVDLEHMESLIDSKTTLIVVNNPSNPCGSVWKAGHVAEIIALAEKHRLPVVADEVYADFVFEGEQFVSFASLSRNAPILTCGGLTKKYLVPGWRMGWILVHDPLNVFDVEVRKGLTSLSQRILGPNTFVQGALKTILNKTPATYFHKSTKLCQENATIFYETLRKIKGLNPIMPSGAMYMMIGIDVKHFPSFKSDLDFTERLITEQSVFCLPAACFSYPNFFRIVLTIPEEVAREACERLTEFCRHHFVEVQEINNNNNNNDDNIINNMIDENTNNNNSSNMSLTNDNRSLLNGQDSTTTTD